jgi:hypothetical protein
MEYKNAKRLGNGWIDCEINHPQYGWIPFTCNPQDKGAAFDVVELYNSMNADPATAAYVPPTAEELAAEKAAEVRGFRDYRLRSEVDPIAGNALRWASLTEEKRQEWAVYRQALLDVPQQEGFPYSITWPVKPE